MIEIRQGPSQNQFRYPKETYPVVWYVIVDGELIDQFATRELADAFAQQYCSPSKPSSGKDFPNSNLMTLSYELATFALREANIRDVGDDVRCDLANKIERLIEEYVDWCERHQEEA